MIILVSLVPALSRAQDSNTPSGRPGTRDYEVVVPGLDGTAVNIFNGALTAKRPLFSARVAGRLSYEVGAHYDSKQVWKLDSHDTADPSDDSWRLSDPRSPPGGRTSLGLGWRADLGRITVMAGQPDGLTLIDETGTPHQLYYIAYSAHSDYITRDSTFYRATPYEHPYDGWKAYRRDGTILEYRHHATAIDNDRSGWYLTKMMDPFGNSIDVQYQAAPFDDVIRTISDSHGRCVTFGIIDDPGLPQEIRGLVNTITFPVFGGSTSTVVFAYEIRTIQTPPSPGPPSSATVAVLHSITRAVGGSGSYLQTYTYDYNSYGELSAVWEPSGAREDYTHSSYSISDDTSSELLGRGVSARCIFDDGSAGGACVSPWMFDRDQRYPDRCRRDLKWRVTLTDPLRHMTTYTYAQESYDSYVPGEDLIENMVQWDRPVVFDGCGDPENGARPLITTSYKWELDDFGLGVGRTVPNNPRLLETRTTFDDGTWSSHDSCDWDNVGHFRTRVVTASQPSMLRAPHATITNYTPILCQWILDTATSISVVEDGQGTRTDTRYNLDGQLMRTVQRAAFDADSSPSCDNSGLPTISVTSAGRLYQQAQLAAPENRPNDERLDGVTDPEPAAYCALPPDQLAPSDPLPSDVWEDITYYGAAGSGDVDSHGHAAPGDTKSTAVGGADSSAVFSTDYEWAWGQQETVRWRGMPWDIASRRIDWGSGLASAQRSSDGAWEAYDYDALGRLLSVTPAHTTPPPPLGAATEAETTYKYSPDFRERDASFRLPGAALTEGSDEYLTMDGQGRRIRAEHRTSDGTIDAQTTSHDALGREIFVSDWYSTHELAQRRTLPPGLPGTKISYVFTPDAGVVSDDPLGRPHETVYSDGQLVQVDYSGLTTHRTINGIRDAAGDLISSTTSIDRDVLGRICHVGSPAGVASSRYTYDSHGNMTSADLDGQQRSWKYDGIGRLRQATQPESGTTTYPTYDALGEPLTRVTADGRIELDRYDTAGRLVSRSEQLAGSVESVVTWTWDEPGHGAFADSRVTTITGDGTTRSLFYEGLQGRLSATLDAVAGASWKTLYGYDALGRCARVEYPCADGEAPLSVKLGSSSGYVTSIGASQAGITRGLVSAVAYEPSGLPRMITYGNGLTQLSAHDSRGKPLEVLVQDPETKAVLFDSGFVSYDGAGDIETIGKTDERGADSFAYDAVGRLATARLANVGTYTLEYDAWGNVTSNALDAPGLPRCVTSSFAGWGDFSAREYRGGPRNTVAPTVTNRISALESECRPGAAISYDEAGNVTQDEVARYDRNVTGQVRLSMNLVTGESVEMHRDGNGWVSWTRGADHLRTVYVRGPDGQVFSEFHELASGGYKLVRHLFYLGNEPVMIRTEESGAQDSWLHLDWLGTIRAETDARGALTGRWDYSPFGRQLPRPGPLSSGLKCFAGHLREGNDDTDDMVMRDYSSLQARFLTPDVLAASADLARPLSFNRYSYAGNTPMMQFDPLGLESVPDPCGGADSMSTFYEEDVSVSAPAVVPFVFDGEFLRFLVDSAERDVPAVSGRRNTLIRLADGNLRSDPSLQGLKAIGPLVEGEYMFLISDIQHFRDLPFLQRMAAHVPFAELGKWAGGEMAWGDTRAWLIPDAATKEKIVDYGRDPATFSLHGGLILGSAGCLDVAGCEDSVFMFLEVNYSSGMEVDLIVNYSLLGQSIDWPSLYGGQ